MATADELRAAITTAQDGFRAALQSAVAMWDAHPGRSESEWSPRQVAEHVAENELWYASQVCKACGYPGLEIEEFSFPSLAEATAAFDAAAAKAISRVKHVSNADLELGHARMGTVEGLLRSYAEHLHTHVAQIRAR